MLGTSKTNAIWFTGSLLMDGTKIQQKIYYGYAKAATKLGADFNLYRSAVPTNPIADGNLIGALKASTNQEWSYMRANKYNNAVWQILIDAQRKNLPLAAKVGDYIVGIPNTKGYIDDNSTYFIIAEQFLMTILAVKCNATLNVIRPSQTTGAGYQGYVGYTTASSETIMTGMPASVLSQARSTNAPTKLPTDTTEPVWKVLMPNLGNVIIRVDDIMIDEFDQEYVVMDNEITELGWRITAKQVVNSR